MYTDTSDSKDTITVTRLTAVYPSQTVTGVLLDASKVYFSTGGKGNYTFTILKNGAKPSDINPIDGVDSIEAPAAVDADKLDTALAKPRLTGPGAKASRANNEPTMTKDVLGREKRKR